MADTTVIVGQCANVSNGTPVTNLALLSAGQRVMAQFCDRNTLPVPNVVQVASREWPFRVCAYYRNSKTSICVERCAPIGTVGRQWSYPGYTVDRTPYGVLQHELGHHVDVMRSGKRAAYFGDFSIAVRGNAGEEPITSYCENDAEWFAEMFRVFVTNPDLLRLIRPRTHRELIAASFTPLFEDSWRERLNGAPARTIVAVERKIDSAKKL